MSGPRRYWPKYLRGAIQLRVGMGGLDHHVRAIAGNAVSVILDDRAVRANDVGFALAFAKHAIAYGINLQ